MLFKRVLKHIIVFVKFKKYCIECLWKYNEVN